MKYFIGIDPGESGALAVLNEKGDFIFVGDCPKDKSFRLGLILDIVKEYPGDYYAYLENLSTNPKWSRRGIGVLFNNWGTWQGLLIGCKIPYLLVNSRTWQNEMLIKDPKKSTKEISLESARILFPKASLKYKKDHGRSDALLITLYAVKHKINFEKVFDNA